MFIVTYLLFISEQKKLYVFYVFWRKCQKNITKASESYHTTVRKISQKHQKVITLPSEKYHIVNFCLSWLFTTYPQLVHFPFFLNFGFINLSKTSVDNNKLLCYSIVPSKSLGTLVDKSLIRQLIQRSNQEGVAVETIAKVVGVSVRTVYRYLQTNYQATESKQIRPNRRIDPQTEKAILLLTQKNPELSRRGIAKLAQKRGIQISDSGVYAIWQRNKERIGEGVNKVSPND